ncbi:RNP1 [Symbiodinium natans]|uniref:RNP1 protein n=1 Tax=Symbiodinium natans TaxID=878477 RepID=A0A812L7R0_9DINO|nr:RNP1 [Symbiodinium natans]
MSIAAQAARNLGGFVPNKIFVGGVPITVTEEQFRQCFAQYGAITKVELHALRGFGYVTYDTVEAVDACLEKYEEHYLSKKWVEVKRSIPRELIDAYEREQRRLHSLHSESQKSASAAKEPAASPKASAAATAPSTPGGKGNAVPGSAPPKAAAAAPGVATARPPPAALPLQRTRTSSSIGSERGGYGGTTPADMGRISQLKEMGFSDEVSRRVLAECAWDVNKAIDRLLLSGVPDDMPQQGDSEKSGTGDPAGVAEPGDPDASAEAQSSDDLGNVNGKSSFFPVEEDPPSTVEADKAASTVATSKNGGVAAEKEPAAAAATSEVASSGTPLAAATEPAAQPATAPAAPTKRLERAKQAWTASDASQLSVSDQEFVYVWTTTATDNGWIHAELAKDQAKVGWLPRCILVELQDGQRWMKTKTKWEARDESQCSVEIGEFCLVWVSSLTTEGWTYVDCQDRSSKGWLPDFCLVWSDP